MSVDPLKEAQMSTKEKEIEDLKHFSPVSYDCV